MNSKVLDLNGNWLFCNKKDLTWKDASVPGCVQMDLMRLQELPDPYFQMNEQLFHKLEGEEWIYKKVFNYTKCSCDELELVFEGVDTLAEAYLNGHLLGKLQNMFIPYRFSVKDFIREGENILEIHFLSSIEEARKLEQESGITLASNCETARPYIRKAQYEYGWDWGPRIEQAGIWKDVYLEAATTAKLEDLFLYTDKLIGNKAYITINGNINSYIQEELTVLVSLSLDNTIAAEAEVQVKCLKGSNSLSLSMELENPELWYPNGSGKQPLYTVKVDLFYGNSSVDSKSFRSGIRTVRLIQDKDEQGKTFIFEINGQQIFAKGACWIPADSLLPRITRSDYEYYIKMAKEGNMNMLRIWGGGIYENKAFYELCDEMGIMVWQDFMYACAHYPDHLEWFSEMAKEEAEKAIKDLRKYTSIVLWCGNNENNWGFHSWWNNGDPEFLGNHIYKKILPELCSKMDPSRPYWVSSPYGGEDPNSRDEGDTHSWYVWLCWNEIEAYLWDDSRFVSEFGMQAMPNWKTICDFTKPEDRRIFSPVMLAHNKAGEGVERLIRYTSWYLGFPKNLMSFAYLTQFNQAEAVKLAVEHWRSRKFLTGGTIYWQLNDCYPVTSWSAIDYSKRKKTLYHYSKKFYDNLLPIIKYEDNKINIYGVNDYAEMLKGTLRVSSYSLAGEKKGEILTDISLEGNTACLLNSLQLSDLNIGYTAGYHTEHKNCTTLPVEHNEELLSTVVYVELIINGKSYTNYKVFGHFRDLSLTEPRIHYVFDGNEITLSSSVPAFSVVIEPEEDVELSDNCFYLEPNRSYTVQCSGKPGAIKLMNLTSMLVND